jgi:hypothetical protein
MHIRNCGAHDGSSLHRLFDRVNVDIRCAVEPRGVHAQHHLDTVSVLLRDPQQILSQHERQRVALVEQLDPVKADKFIVGRVSTETKARLRALVERENLSESALLRRLIEFVLLKAGLSPILTESPTGARSLRGARLMIRLRPDDQILLRERATARGMPPATYVSVLTRSHLRSLAPLPAEELLAL